MSRKFPGPILGPLVALCLLAPRPAPAYQPVPTTGLDLVPPKSVMLVSVRLSELVRKLDLKKSGIGFALLSRIEDRFGIPAGEIERLTFAVTDRDGGVVVLVRTAGKVDRAAVLKACSQEPREVTRKGFEVYVSQQSGTAVHFPCERTVLISDQPDALRSCVSKENGTDARHPVVKELLAAAPRHDVVAWIKAISGDHASPRRPCCMTETPGVTVTSYKPPEEDGDGRPSLPFVPLSLPRGTESVTLTLDVGPQVALDLGLHFRDATAARSGVKLVQGGVDAARGLMLMSASALEVPRPQPFVSPVDRAACSEEAKVSEKDVDQLATLLRQTEKALQRVQAKADRTKVVMSARLPLDGKQLRAAALTLCQLDACGFCSGVYCERWADVPPPSYQAAPAAPAVYQVPTVAGPCCPGGTCPPAKPVAVYQPAPVADAPPRIPPPPAAPPRPPECPKASVTVAVANVCPSIALLFAVQDSGELKFLHKVLPGEAIDVPGNEGDRWAVVFADRPQDSEKLLLTTQTKTWLLRDRTPRGPSVTPLPGLPAGTGGSSYSR